MKPHKNEWNRLRKKYWQAIQNISKGRTRKRRTYWENQVRHMGRRLLKLGLRQRMQKRSEEPAPLACVRKFARVNAP